ncbi:RGS domain-containing protein [Paraphysoderma sedebokerense]|nr:RGS domain-containing protein [Paraphysoderma sedebokerense]
MNVVERMMFRIISIFKLKRQAEHSASNDLELATSKSSIEIVNLGPRTILKAAGVTYIISTIILLTVLGYADCYRNNGVCKNVYVRDNGLDFLPLYIFVGLYFLLIPCFLYLIKNVKDSYYIKLEFQLTLSTFFILFCLYLVDRFGFGKTLTPAGDLVWLFSVVVICHTISVTAPVLGVDIMKLRPTKESVNNTLDNFNKILMDRRLFAQFKKSLAEDFSIENGLFFEDLLALENDENKRKNSPKLYEKSIIAIYQSYIKSGANNEINIPAPTRKKIIQEINAKNFELEIYEQAKKEVCQMMYQNSFPRFLTKLKGGSLNGSTAVSTISKSSEANNIA